MKSIITFAILLIAVIAGCTSPQPFTGRIVDKEYTAGHMCHNNNYTHLQQASFTPRIVPHTTPPPHHHSWQPATVTVWVANRNEVKSFSVDSTSYHSWVLGSKVTFGR
jgi:hypothetical protein